MTYSVAIRTLGTARDKYLRELQSIDKQTIQPEHIFVYIPHGYDLPKETIGKEEYIRCDKGMITQRSLPFDEITSDYILFLDDDIYLPEDCVEKLMNALSEYNADVISADAYQLHTHSWGAKLKYCTAGTFPHFSRNIGFKIRRSSFYSYPNDPSCDVLPSESSCGALVMVKKSAYKSIHFEDERWMECFRYPQGEDQLFYQKLRLHGYKLIVHFNSGIIHLDAGSGHVKDPKEKDRIFSLTRYVMWYRTMYDVKISNLDKFLNTCAYYGSVFYRFPLCLYLAIRERKLFYITNIYNGIRDAKHYIKSDTYQKVPKFDAYIR